MPWRKPVSKERMNSRGGSKRDFEIERVLLETGGEQQRRMRWEQTKEWRTGGEKAVEMRGK